jgi:hypothetical protein
LLAVRRKRCNPDDVAGKNMIIQVEKNEVTLTSFRASKLSSLIVVILWCGEGKHF